LPLRISRIADGHRYVCGTHSSSVPASEAAGTSILVDASFASTCLGVNPPTDRRWVGRKGVSRRRQAKSDSPVPNNPPRPG
jgi:hypothetical protein